MNNNQNIPQQIYSLLSKEYPNPKTALNYDSEWQLLVAVILSAQCTDVLVNKVTAEFFPEYPTYKSVIAASIDDLEQQFKRINYYKTKAKAIHKAAEMISNNGGTLTMTISELTKLPGVGRKVANVIINELTDIPEGIVVDTHVLRLSQRLGLTTEKKPEKIEKDLIRLYQQDQWKNIAHFLILHGRSVCKARRPKCSECVLKEICPSAFKSVT
jgi:endonuclease III